MSTKQILTVKKGKSSGGTHSKIRITDLAAANTVGSKLLMFAIGKAKKPRCFKFKKIKTLPCKYRAQKKSWMDGVFFLKNE